MITMTVPSVADFDLKHIILSHDWYQFAPFQYEEDERGRPTLSRKHRLPDGTLVNLMMRETGARSVIINVQGRAILTSVQRNHISQKIKRMLMLDWQPQPFYKSLQRRGEYKWVAEKKLGRLLRAPTVWEDMVKVMLLTNSSSEQAAEISANLCTIDPGGTFPTPQQIAVLSEEELSKHVNSDQRVTYLHQVAKNIAAGDVNVEAWRDLSTDDLFTAVKSVSGFGDSAAGMLLRLLGKYDKLVIDATAREAYSSATGKSAEDDEVVREYFEQFGEWRGLMVWLDYVRPHFEPEKEGTA